MHKPHIQRSSLRFRRFQRAKWAAFGSMHREVTIGHLAARVADCSLAKTACIAVAAMLALPHSALAQNEATRETHTLAEVQISLPADSLSSTSEPAAILYADDIRQRNIHSVAELVAQLPGVDVRTRGVGDAQADISLRGGTFDQLVLLLNGINLTDAQTGHHSLDLPIDIAMVQRVELLTPAQLMSLGIVAFCGGVNLVVDESYADRIMAEMSAGSFGTANATLLLTHHTGAWSLTAAAAYHRSDGYMNNTDYRHGSLFLQASRHSSRHDLHLQLGGQLKEFGSHGFYSLKYPDQFETTRTLTASASDHLRLGRLRLDLTAYGRLHRDRFELFREGKVNPVPAWYTSHNHHLGSIGGLRVRAALPLAVGEWTIGGDLRREGIVSNVLGLPDSTLSAPYTHRASRLLTSLYTGWHFASQHWELQAVALGAHSSQFGFDYGVATDATYRLGNMSLQASFSHTFRQPTFTDLYYHSATQQSNPALNSEHSTTAILTLRHSTKHTAAYLSTYYRAGRDIIDWVRRPEEEMWYSMNHTAVDAFGIDAALQATVRSVQLSASYSLCHVTQDAGSWISNSALDYLRHRADMHLTWHATSQLALRGGVVYRQRAGSWADTDGKVHDYGSALLADAAIEWDATQLYAKLFSNWQVTLFAEGHNLLDAHYRDHGGIPMPGRTLMVGLRLGAR